MCGSARKLCRVGTEVRHPRQPAQPPRRQALPSAWPPGPAADARPTAAAGLAHRLLCRLRGRDLGAAGPAQSTGPPGDDRRPARSGDGVGGPLPELRRRQCGGVLFHPRLIARLLLASGPGWGWVRVRADQRRRAGGWGWAAELGEPQSSRP